MEDIFYFSKEKVTLEDIQRIAEEAGYQVEHHIGDTGHWMNIHYQADAMWTWLQMDEDDIHLRDIHFAGFEPADWETVRRLGYKSAFTVSFRPASLPVLVTFLKRVLEEYGGWVGNDTDGFEPVYTVDDIEQLSDFLL